MVRTFVDSGVLIAAMRSAGRDRERALALLEEPGRVFLTSPFVYLEVVPKATYFKRALDVAFYQRFFETAESVATVENIEAVARAEALRTGLSAMDALHVAAAFLASADEFITTERPERAIHRTTLVKMVSLFDS
ncbi:MAG: type II toxin-antitoxin system VapC family toxin [Acidobacteria bacterium]|nr:type II toxin-antitoxin system VapC family toxin [Acidobacteriota bacterium]